LDMLRTENIHWCWVIFLFFIQSIKVWDVMPADSAARA
jgi:hypothetical protein